MCLGIPGQLVQIIDRNEHRAVVDVDGVKREINIGLVLSEAGGVKEGDWVLVHVGFAMSKIDPEEAERTLSFIRELGSLYDDEIDQLKQDTPLYDGDGDGAGAPDSGATSDAPPVEVPAEVEVEPAR